MLHTKYQGTRHCRFRQEGLFCFPNLKVKQRAKPRNRYNQVPQLTRDTIWESDTIQENNTHKRAKRLAPSQQVITCLCKIYPPQEYAIYTTGL